MSTPYEIPELGLGGTTRERDGIIVTAREQVSGRVESFHEVDQPSKALAVVCELLDAMEGDWKIVSVSTPSSIYRDLQGMRGEISDREDEDRRAGPSDPRSTEYASLGGIGRLDMLQPLKQPGHDHGHRRIA